MCLILLRQTDWEFLHGTDLHFDTFVLLNGVIVDFMSLFKLLSQRWDLRLTDLNLLLKQLLLDFVASTLLNFAFCESDFLLELFFDVLKLLNSRFLHFLIGSDVSQSLLEALDLNWRVIELTLK